MKKYNLFLDDERSIIRIKSMIYNYQKLVNEDHKIILVKNYTEFKNKINKFGVPEFVSFDHDLAHEHYIENKQYNEYKEKTGYECAKYLLEYCVLDKKEFPSYYIHSMNPVGKNNIEKLIKSYKKHFGI